MQVAGEGNVIVPPFEQEDTSYCHQRLQETEDRENKFLFISFNFSHCNYRFT